MKNLYLILLFVACSFAFLSLKAQPQTVRGTVSAAENDDHLYVAVGQPFFQQLALGDYELSMGVAQAQWVRDTVYDVITYNTPYIENYFDLSVPIESHKDSVYVVNGGTYKYDLLRTLYLIVCPQNMTDFYDNDIVYDVLALSGHCWTRQNLRSPVEGAMAYSSPLHPIVPEVYGLLYTWTAAQLLCPEGWHLPDAEESARLSSNPTSTLRSTEGWINGEENTNSTGFTAYPAGRFNFVQNRFEGLGTETDWWTTNNTTVYGTVSGAVGTNVYSSLQIPYYCDTPIHVTYSLDDALSVRCVKTNIWPE